MRLRPSPARRSANATHLHRRSIDTLLTLGARLGLGPDPRTRAAHRIGARRRFPRPHLHLPTSDRTLPAIIALFVFMAAVISVAPSGASVASAVGGTEGAGTEPRLAIAGLVGGVDGEIGAPADLTRAAVAPEPARGLAADTEELAEPEASPSAIEGPFLEDGTLLKPVAVDTTVTDASDQLQTHTVKAGETLTGIANAHDVSMMTIWWANDLDSKNALHVGQELVIPPVDGLIVTVKDGDTLDSLAVEYGSNPQAIVEVNGLDDPTLIIGQVLMMPGARGEAIPTPTPTPTPTPKPKPKPKAPAAKAPAAKAPAAKAPAKQSSGGGGGGGGKFAWPVVGGGNYISQYYRSGHYGLDIAADHGTKVVAATGGTVTFAGWKNNGGGYQVWISHGGGLNTTYNHLSAVTVGRGQSVGRGQQVGRIGRTGRATGPHLHFEVWKGAIWSGGSRVNPLGYI